MIAEVIINTTARSLNRTFDYNIPKNLEDFIYIGTKVLVPFGRKKELEEGYVVNIKDKTEYEVKDIAELGDRLELEQIELAKWMSKRYFCNISDCIKLMQTPGTRTKQNKIQDKTINTIYLKSSTNLSEASLSSLSSIVNPSSGYSIFTSSFSLPIPSLTTKKSL